MKEKDVLAGILGLVVGDALGVPVKFESRLALSQNPVTEMRGGGTHSQPKGTWSDDSSMALCLMESLTHGLDYDDQMSQFVRWASEAYMTAHDEVFDMGIATRKALQRFMQGIPALQSGGSGEYDNGNGSLMRILPLAMYLHSKLGDRFPDDPEAYKIIENASSLTHAHPVSQIACAFYCAIANEFLCHRYQESDIQSAIEKVKKHYIGASQSTWLCSFRRIDIPTLKMLFNDEIKSSGYVVSTLEAALWCLLTTNSFRDCLIQAVNLGDDTDTVAAVAGGLAGLKYGLEGIPQDWLEAIAKRNDIEELCMAFARSL